MIVARRPSATRPASNSLTSASIRSRFRSAIVTIAVARLDVSPALDMPRRDHAVDRRGDPGLGDQGVEPVAARRAAACRARASLQAAAVDVEVLRRRSRLGEQRLVAADLAVVEADVGLGLGDPRLGLGT